NDGHIFAFRKPRFRVVERFIETVPPFDAGFGDSLEIFQGSGRKDHCGERGGVWRNDDVLAKTTLEPEARYSEAGILVCQVEITRVKSGLRNSPGHFALSSIIYLTAHHLLVRLAQHAAFRRAHYECRH